MIEAGFLLIDILMCAGFGWLAITNNGDWWDVFQGYLIAFLPMAALSIMTEAILLGAVFGKTWALVPAVAGIHLIAGMITYSGISK